MLPPSLDFGFDALMKSYPDNRDPDLSLIHIFSAIKTMIRLIKKET